MEINNYTKKIIRYFPLCFLIFLTIYLLVKFIFIFFFRAAFEPQFMFDLTPYYILSGVNYLHLIVLSLIVIFIDAYLHLKINKKNLAFSFIPTGIPAPLSSTVTDPSLFNDIFIVSQRPARASSILLSTIS